MERERELVSLSGEGRKFQRRMVEGRYIGIIKRRVSSKWTDKVVWVKRAQRG